MSQRDHRRGAPILVAGISRVPDGTSSWTGSRR